LSITEFVHEVDVLSSEPLGYLGEYVFTLKLFAFGHESPIQDYQKDRLESMLKNTAVLLRKRKVIPKSETDIQRVMQINRQKHNICIQWIETADLFSQF